MSPSEEDFLADFEEAEAIGHEAFGREPVQGDYGMLVSGDASPGIGGGIQAFMWFESRKAMLAFLRKYGFLIHPPHSRLDLNTARSFAYTMARRIELNELSDAEAPEALTQGLRGVTQFHWLGSFDSLVSEDTPFGLKVRQQFRDSSDGRPIEPDEEEEFLEFLSLYGV